MDKKEKYYNYIVDDLISKTEIDYDLERIKVPFYPSLSFISLYLPSPFIPPSLSLSLPNYLKGMYGTHDEEIQIIWGLYKDRIISLIKK